MNVQIRGTKRHDNHRMHVSTWETPNWFEKIFMFKRQRVAHYVGKGTKWYVMELGKVNPLEYRAVKSKSLNEILKAIHP